ncbi:ABC transporter substrate-binding protein [Micromonospora sp. CPCC 206060]|uniref:ABC transporter substrate-binding protein n=1 Tax=Micromonospora sp. CPCC 206060 TaxID=3122406 RepID=UPI002FEE9834
MSGRNRLVAAVAAAALALTVSGCGGSEKTDSPDAASVTYLTSFGTFGRDSYAYVALEKGYFEEAGLKVTIKPGTGTGTVDVMKLIGSGQADYGTGDLSGVITTMANEKFPVRAVAAIHQRSMAGIASLDKAIDSPEKLAGASIADSAGSTNMIIFPAYAKVAGIDPKSVKFVPSSPQALPQLLAAGSVDAIGQFAAGKPLLEKAAGGKTVTMLPYADKLPDLYGNGLLVSAAKLDSDREQVEKFTAALVKGLIYAVDHPEEAAQLLKKHDRTADETVAAAELTEMRPYVMGDGGPAGELDRERVARMITLLAGTGTLKSTPSADDLGVYDIAKP